MNNQHDLNTRPQKDYRHILILALIFAGYALLRLNNTWQIKEPKIYPDSSRYLEIASQKITSVDFWASDYPIVVPAVQKILQRDLVSISWFQTLFSIAAWIILAISIHTAIKIRWLKYLAILAVLAFSLDRVILLWDWVILSESLSGSLLILSIAAWLWFVQTKRLRPAAAITVVILGVLWSFTRDSNALINLGIALIVAFWLILRKEYRYLLISGIFILAYMLSNASAITGGRWIGPSLSVVGIRVLTDQEAIAFFEDNGMPVNEQLMSFAGQKAGPVDEGFGDDPNLTAFHTWYRENGKTVLGKYILSTPRRSLLAPLENMSPLFDTHHLFYYQPKGFVPILPPPLDGAIFFDNWGWTVAISSLVIFCAGLFLAIRYPDQRRVVPITMLLLIYPHAFLIWHVSACDMERHAYQFRLHFNLAVLVFFLFSLDTIFMKYGSTLSAILAPVMRVLHKIRYALIAGGTLTTVLATFLDPIIGSAEFSIGYAQGAGILFGLGLIWLGGWLHFSWKGSTLSEKR